MLRQEDLFYKLEQSRGAFDAEEAYMTGVTELTKEVSIIFQNPIIVISHPCVVCEQAEVLQGFVVRTFAGRIARV